VKLKFDLHIVLILTDDIVFNTPADSGGGVFGASLNRSITRIETINCTLNASADIPSSVD